MIAAGVIAKVMVKGRSHYQITVAGPRFLGLLKMPGTGNRFQGFRPLSHGPTWDAMTSPERRRAMGNF